MSVEGVLLLDDDDAPGVEDDEVSGVVLLLDEAEPPAAGVLLAPVPLVELLLEASAPGAGVGVGVVVVDDDDEVLGDEAGGGVVTVLSSFLLQAVRPTITRAAIRSERFILFSSRRTSHGISENGRRSGFNSCAVRERPTRSS